MSQASEAMLAPGIEAQYEQEIPREWTIAQYDSSLPAVLSTPAMIGMMEIAAAQAVLPALPPGTLTVGTRIEVDHLKAAPTGTKVIAKARLTEVNGKFLTFEVQARRGDDLIGRGRVFRAVVDRARFVRGADARPSH